MNSLRLTSNMGTFSPARYQRRRRLGGRYTAGSAWHEAAGKVIGADLNRFESKVGSRPPTVLPKG